MLRLLSIEIHKLIYSKASKILIFIYFGLLTTISLFAFVNVNIGLFEIDLIEQGIFNFPEVWHFSTYIMSMFKIFLLLVIVSMVSNEYSNKTLKQNLIDGLSKKEFILTKFYTLLAFSIISTLFVFVVSLVLGLIYSDDKSFVAIFSGLEYLFAFFLELTAFFSFGLFLGVLIKRSAFAVGAMFVWYIVELILKSIMFFAVGKEMSANLSQVLPLGSITNLNKNPFIRLRSIKDISSQIGEELNIDLSVTFGSLIIVIFWIVIFVYLSYAILKKRDL